MALPTQRWFHSVAEVKCKPIRTIYSCSNALPPLPPHPPHSSVLLLFLLLLLDPNDPLMAAAVAGPLTNGASLYTLFYLARSG
jgi:hypothetical protein